MERIKNIFALAKNFFLNKTNQTSGLIFSKKNKFYKFWIILMIFTILYNQWIYPFLICFYNHQGAYQELFFDGINLLDIIVDILIKKNKRNNFFFYFIELLVSCPYFIFLSIPDESVFVNYYLLIKFVGLLRLLKMFILMSRYRKRYKNILSFVIVEKSLKEFFLVFYEFILIIHIATCLNYLSFAFDSEFEFDPNGWIVKAGLIDASNIELYFQNSYYIFTMAITQGYGNITPKTNWEKLVAIVYMFFGNTIFSRFFGKIIQLTQYSNKKKIRKEKEEFYWEFSRKFYFPNKYIVQVLSDLNVAEKSVFYLKHLDEIKQEFSELSDELFKEVVMHLHYKLYQNFDFFSTAPPSFFKKIYNYFEFEAFNKGDVLYKTGYPAKEIYFLVKGSIRLKYRPGFKNEKNRICFHFCKNSFFGELEFLKKKDRKFTAKAGCKSLLFKIDGNIFFQILEEYPFLKNKFLKDSYYKFERQKRLKRIYQKDTLLHVIPKKEKNRWQSMKRKISSLNWIEKYPKEKKKKLPSKSRSSSTSLARSTSNLVQNFTATFHKTRFTPKIQKMTINLEELETIASIKLEKLLNEINIDLFQSVTQEVEDKLKSDKNEEKQIIILGQHLKFLETKIEVLKSLEKSLEKFEE